MSTPSTIPPTQASRVMSKLDATGYVSQTQAAINAERVSVKAVNAKGDGVISGGITFTGTDDYVALASLFSKLSADGGGDVFFPPGIYRNSTAMLAVPANVRIYGANRFKSFIGPYGFTLSTGCRVHDMGFWGNLNSDNLQRVAITTANGASQTEWGVDNCYFKNHGAAVYINRAGESANSQPERFRITKNTFDGVTAIYANRLVKALIDDNDIITTQSGSRAILALGGYENRITRNRISGGGLMTTGINFIFNRALANYRGVMRNNVISQNIISGVLEESISFDVRGSEKDGVATCEYDVIASKGTSGPLYQVTLTNAGWSGAGSVYAGYYLILCTGHKDIVGVPLVIAAQSDALLTVALTAAQYALISGSEKVVIGIPAFGNTIQGNTIDATVSTTYAIHLYGMCFGNTVQGNTAKGSGSVGAGVGTAQTLAGGIGCRSIWGLTTASTKTSLTNYTGNLGVAPSMNNTFTGNTVDNTDLYSDTRNYASQPEFAISGNVFSGNAKVGVGRIRLNWSKNRVYGNGLETVTTNAPETIFPAQSAVAATITGSTSETVLATVTIPGGSMGANGSLRITLHWTYTSSGSGKTIRVRFGGAAGSVMMSAAPTSTTSFKHQVQISNRNSESSQYSPPNASGGWSSVSSSNSTSSVDTSVDADLVVSMQLGSGSDTASLESYLVELIP